MTMPKHLQELRDSEFERQAKHERMWAFGYKFGFNACFDAMSKMSEDEGKIVRDRALNYFYEHGGTANRDAHGAMGHFEDGAKFGITLGRMNEHTKAIREVIEYLKSKEASEYQRSRDNMGVSIAPSGWASRIESKFLPPKNP